MMIKKDEFLSRLSKKGAPIRVIRGIPYQYDSWSHEEAGQIYDAFLNTLLEFLSEGEDVLFHGFGKFEIRDTKERLIPSISGENMIIPTKRRIHFTPGKPLKRIIADIDKDDGN